MTYWASDSTPFNILFIDDEAANVDLARAALWRAGVSVLIKGAEDGVAGLIALRKSDAHVQDLVLLDIHMPRKGGFEVLEEIKSDPALKCIPVIMISSSELPKDVMKSYSLNANCYVQKPADALAFMETIKILANFWFSTAILPSAMK